MSESLQCLDENVDSQAVLPSQLVDIHLEMHERPSGSQCAKFELKRHLRATYISYFVRLPLKFNSSRHI